MAAPRTTLWPRDEHTEGKHLVLRHYLEAWFPILAMGDRNKKILFVDGFAGPGEYTGGEEGSPLVAMRVMAEHSARSSMSAEVVFQFIEEKPARAKHLARLVEEVLPELPPTARVHVHTGRFDSTMTEVIDQLKEQGQRMAPAFVMIDPFGVKGMPMSVIREILANRSCEVYVSFMWEYMNRFLSEPGYKSALDEMFGTREWRAGAELAGDAKKGFLHALYRDQLKKVGGAKQVVLFHLFRGKRLKYSIFFGTGHTTGSDRMKKAIWKVAPFGDFSFRGGQQRQGVLLGLAQPDLEPLAKALEERFRDAGWVSIEEVLEFVRSDETDYHDGQVKTPVLKPMEQEGRIEVKRKAGTKRRTYPEGKCWIHFRPHALSLF